MQMIYYLMKYEGLCLGPSAALNLVGAVKVARKLGKGKTIVTILCDPGERYSTKIFNKEWLEKFNITVNDVAKEDLSFVKD